LVTLENLMNLLLDMGLQEEHDSVVKHLEQMEQQIVQRAQAEKERCDSLNRALYGAALAEQEQNNLLRLRRQQQQLLQEGDGGRGGRLGGGVDKQSRSSSSGASASAAGTQLQPQQEALRSHPFAPELVIVGRRARGFDDIMSDDETASSVDDEEEDGDRDQDRDQDTGGDPEGGDVLLDFQAQERASRDEQEALSAYGGPGLLRMSRASLQRLTSAAAAATGAGAGAAASSRSSPGKRGGAGASAGAGGAEWEWSQVNNNTGRMAGRSEALDEEDGWKWSGRIRGGLGAGGAGGDGAGTGGEGAGGEGGVGGLQFDLKYMGSYNNSAELTALKRELASKYSPGGGGGTSGGGSDVFSSTVDRFRRSFGDGGGGAGVGGSGGGSRTSKLRNLQTLQSRNEVQQQEQQDDELPSGNCAIM
jgi:hypothetical protein